MANYEVAEFIESQGCLYGFTVNVEDKTLTTINEALNHLSAGQLFNLATLTFEIMREENLRPSELDEVFSDVVWQATEVPDEVENYTYGIATQRSFASIVMFDYMLKLPPYEEFWLRYPPAKGLKILLDLEQEHSPMDSIAERGAVEGGYIANLPAGYMLLDKGQKPKKGDIGWQQVTERTGRWCEIVDIGTDFEDPDNPVFKAYARKIKH